MTGYTVAIDDTPAAWKTVEWVDGALRPGDRVRLLTVSEFYGETYTRSEGRLDAAERRLAESHPDVVIAHDIVGGPTADRLVLDGSRDDVLVIGSQQVHRFTATLAGRVAERVVAHSTRPVLVVPENWERTEGPVLVGVDSVTAAAALGFAADLAGRSGRDLVLVRAWRPIYDSLPYSGVYLDEDRDLWEHEGRLELDAAIRAIGKAHPDLHVRGARREGSIADSLLHEAAAEHAALIVVGRRHHSALSAFLGGSVSEEIMHRGHTPLCVVPPTAVPDAATRVIENAATAARVSRTE
ncbi:universal stress protein [Curtobacterium ammoniigenes]|uniref:universal stress protein n=1 Tax=Curtobacterium ammoniigenes TaxID=395387 RepID=UPI000831B088|nr:universal stress protein [Curtobacterium ammoniigenes]